MSNKPGYPARRYDMYRYLKWAMIHTAMIIFFADFIAACWPAFEAVWQNHAKVAVAIAALTAAGAEYVNARVEEANEKSKGEESHDA